MDEDFKEKELEKSAVFRYSTSYQPAILASASSKSS
jgi:hypothetical protein